MFHCSTSLVEQQSLLQDIAAIDSRALNSVQRLIDDRQMGALRNAYQTNLKKQAVDIGLNLFVLISDIYHRENFHSDILKVLLDPTSPHKEGDKYLRLFLEFVTFKMPGLDIDPADYIGAAVLREQGRIDLLILGGKPRNKAIIIENKMNGAPDRPQQLPRYLQYVKDKGGDCQAIVYLRLNRLQHPDTTGWTEAQQTEIKEKLLCVTAYSDLPDDLLNGWLYRCEKASEHIDALLILRQYGTLLRKLGGNVMNKPLMEKFYSLMLSEENYQAARSLHAMLDDLILYRVETLIARFQNDLAPFTAIGNHQNYDAYLYGFLREEIHFGIDLIVQLESDRFQFWDRDDREGVNGHARLLLQEMNCLEEYRVTGGMFTKEFAFPSQQQALIEHIVAFKNQMQRLPSKREG